ncbi:hypothetical protein [Longimicrobium sp.]|uniref:hypothetical protein n=1 Tax=Longimicrobium sp. TaxID=2029185 RepID=UPI002F938FD0
MPGSRISAAVARLALPALALGAALPAAAQDGGCSDGRVSEIFIDVGDVFELGSPDLEPRLSRVYRAANDMHLRTRESIIARELLFEAGQCYRSALLADSERTLRSFPFLADASVFGVRQPDGNWHVVVRTRDEWSTRLEPQMDGDSDGWGLIGVEFREENVLGRGLQISLFAKEYQRERVYGGSVSTPQLFGTQVDAELGLERTPVGVAVTQRLAYPFRGENGRWAWRQQFERMERNFEFFVPREDGGVRRTYFAEKRQSFDVGTVTRFGPRGSLTLLGVALAGERTEYPRDWLSMDGDGGQPVPVAGNPPLQVEPVPVTGLDTLSSVRVVFLAGHRSVYFKRLRGLDAVHGTEDVRMGIDVEAGVGRSLSALSTDDDLSVAVGVMAAGDLIPGVLAGVRATAEGRRDYGAEPERSEWRDLFGQFDGWAYWRPHAESRHTFVAAVSAAGGFRTRVPFQLTLGHRAGVRGLPAHAYPGERRAVATLEHRAYLGWPNSRLFDLGSAAFVDVGKMWAGGDAFAASSPVAMSVGVGLRAAFPPGSRRTYRLDVATPLVGGVPGRRLTVTLGIGQAVGRNNAGEDAQLRRSSRRPLSASLFSFPD